MLMGMLTYGRVNFLLFFRLSYLLEGYVHPGFRQQGVSPLRLHLTLR